MSDTPITITPEERRTWRNEHANWTGRDSDLVVRVRLMDALEAAESENARLLCDYGRWADMISRLPRRIACEVCPHRTDRHKANCLECCPWEAARRAVAGEGEVRE